MADKMKRLASHLKINDEENRKRTERWVIVSRKAARASLAEDARSALNFRYIRGIPGDLSSYLAFVFAAQDSLSSTGVSGSLACRVVE